MNKRERYACALIAEECGEVVQMCGKALRFGLNTPHSVNGKRVKDAPTCLHALEKELGDVIAAIDYAIRRGVVHEPSIRAAHDRKLAKLLSPQSKDFLGRRLAP